LFQKSFQLLREYHWNTYPKEQILPFLIAASLSAAASMIACSNNEDIETSPYKMVQK